MLEARNLSKTFESTLFSKEKVQAVKQVSFVLKQGQTIGIAGNSGCGKSTLARIIAGLIPTDSGEILFYGDNIKNLKGRKQRSRKIQIIFQHPESALDPSMRIRDSLLEPLRIHAGRAGKEMEEKKLKAIMDMVHIDEVLLKRYPHQISGGEAQRICIGRMLMLEPEVVLLDEPTSMLDVSVQAYIMNLLKDLQKKLGFSYLIISHDLEILKWICDEILIMNAGEIVEQGSPEEIFEHPVHPFTKELLNAYNYF